MRKPRRRARAIEGSVDVTSVAIGAGGVRWDPQATRALVPIGFTSFASTSVLPFPLNDFNHVDKIMHSPPSSST